MQLRKWAETRWDGYTAGHHHRVCTHCCCQAQRFVANNRLAVLSLLVTSSRAKAKRNQECVRVTEGHDGASNWTNLGHKSSSLHLRMREKEYLASLLQWETGSSLPLRFLHHAERMFKCITVMKITTVHYCILRRWSLIVLAGLRHLRNIVLNPNNFFSIDFMQLGSEIMLRVGRTQRASCFYSQNHVCFFDLWASPERQMPKPCWEPWTWDLPASSPAPSPPSCALGRSFLLFELWLPYP